MQKLLNQYKSYLSKGSAPGASLQNAPGVKDVPTPGADVLSKPLSPSTIKNYISDTKHFLTYLKDTYQEPSVKPSHITSVTIKNYLEDTSKTTPKATLKRRFSSLKRFTSFLLTTKLINEDPLKHLKFNNTKKTTSSSKILDTFKAHLKSEGLSNSTIKNYASDVNHYLLWATKNTNITDKHFQTR